MHEIFSFWYMLLLHFYRAFVCTLIIRKECEICFFCYIFGITRKCMSLCCQISVIKLQLGRTNISTGIFHYSFCSRNFCFISLLRFVSCRVVTHSTIFRQVTRQNNNIVRGFICRCYF